MRGFRGVLLWGGFLAIVALVGGGFFLLYQAPSPGASFSWDGARGAWVVSDASSGSALRNGDVLRKIGSFDATRRLLFPDTIFITDRSDLFRWFEEKRRFDQALSEKAVDITIERGGRTVWVTQPIPAQGFAFVGRFATLHLLNGLLFFLVGAVVLLRRPPDATVVLFYLFCLSTAVLFITFAIPQGTELGFSSRFLPTLHLANLAVFLFSPALLFHLSLVFPRPRPWLAGRSWLAAPFYLALAGVAAGAWIEVLAPVAVLLLLLGLGGFVHSLLKAREETVAKQMKWVVTGLLAGSGPWVILNGIPFLVTGHNHLDFYVTSLFFALIPLSLAFAIQKTRLFDIDNLFETVVVNWLAFVLLSFSDIFIAGLLGHLIASYAAMGKIGQALLPVIFLLPLYILLRDQLRNWLRRRLTRLAPARVAAEGISPAPGGAPPVSEGSLELLTRREVEILQALDRGLRYKEIAGELSISPHTVHTHVKHIYEKLGVKTRSGAVHKARDSRII